MRNHPITSRASVTAGAPFAIVRDTDGMLDALTSIDHEGWDGPTATALLTYIREELIRPLAIDVGLRGGAASQAEATAWEAVWLKMCEPGLRSVRSPWGVIWQTARRALLSEIIAARWGTDPRRAWEHDVDERAGGQLRPVSIDPLLAIGREPAAHPSPPAPLPETRVSVALDRAADALVVAGWPPETAGEIVAQVVAMDEPLSHGATVIGWRPLAARLGLRPWQARRLTVILRGSVDRPGLLARLIAEGPRIADEPAVSRALAGTLNRGIPSPTRGVPSCPEKERRPQGLAS